MTDPESGLPNWTSSLSSADTIVPLRVSNDPLPMQGDLIHPVTASIDRDYHISPHFTFGQLIITDHRDFIQKNYDEGLKLVNHLTRLCNEILEPIVTLVGVVPTIHSAFRCPELNTLLGASKTSQHMDAEAADTVYPGKGLKEVFNILMASKLPYGQIIYEFASWVHVSIQDPVLHAGKIRQNFVAASNSKGETVYTTVSSPL